MKGKVMPQPMPTIANKEAGDFGSRWVEAGSITSAEAALAVDERDNASVEAFATAKTIIYKRRTNKVWAEARFRLDGSENDTSVLQVYAASGVDHYKFMGQLTITQGQQDSTSEHFADTIAPANEDTFFEAAEWDAANGIATYAWKMKGYDRFLIIVSTLGVTTVDADIREYNAS